MHASRGYNRAWTAAFHDPICEFGSESLVDILERTELAWVSPRRRCTPSLNDLALGDVPAGEVSRVAAPQRARLVVGVGCGRAGLGLVAGEVPRMPPGVGVDIPGFPRAPLRHLQFGRHEFTRVRACVPALDLSFGRPLVKAPGFHSRLVAAAVPRNDCGTGESGSNENHSGDGKTHIGLCGFCGWDGSC